MVRRIELGTDEQAGFEADRSADRGFSGTAHNGFRSIVFRHHVRQAQRLLKRYQDSGGAALIHKARGRIASNRINSGIRDYALELVRQNYRDFGPTLAAEALRERHGLEVSRETLRKWMVESGLWLSRQQRRSFHQPRLRRQHYGELIQIDGSEHRWFEDRADPCTLLLFIDDATSNLMQLRFVPSESADRTSMRCVAICRVMAALLPFTPTSILSSAL